ncbi:MAG: sugar phosphate isomerase/epimerase [Bryobacteraceae bacterium]|nr:sugar phosphate isomerase/epimerase [Bryobacteraceae bacterium]
MALISPLEVGLMFWGERQPERTLRAIKALGMRCGHLGFAGHVSLNYDTAKEWRSVADSEDFGVTAVFAAFEGESYADIPTVQKTVGFIPKATRALREKRSLEVVDAASAMGVPVFGCHIGFVPDDHTDADFVAVRDMVRRICDHAAQYNVFFALETGQETAQSLLHFIEAVERRNLKVNFDPANMILYGTAEPIPALELLAQHVVSVHCKDGIWPDKDKPGSLGTEMPLGEGAVGIDRFVETLRKIGYTSPLVMEREVSLDQDMDDRHKEGVSHHEDIRAAVALLNSLRDRNLAAV